MRTKFFKRIKISKYNNFGINKDKLQDPKYGHHRGVLSLAAIEDKNWLLSCGVEHFVMVWDLVVGKHVGMLQGHSQSLLGVKILNGTNQIITGDSLEILRGGEILQDVDLVVTDPPYQFASKKLSA